jgi:hypothetical protein
LFDIEFFERDKNENQEEQWLFLSLIRGGRDLRVTTVDRGDSGHGDLTANRSSTTGLRRCIVVKGRPLTTFSTERKGGSARANRRPWRKIKPVYTYFETMN